MATRITFYHTLICFFLTGSVCFSQVDAPLLSLLTEQQVIVRKPFLQQFADALPQRSLSYIRHLAPNQWRAVNSVNFGRQGSPGWVRFQLQSPIRQTLLLEIKSHFIDSVQVWLIAQPKTGKESIRVYRATGFHDLVHDQDSPMQHRYVIKPLDLIPDVRYSVYIRGWVPPADVLKFGVTLWHPVAFWRYLQRDITGWAVFVGLVLMSVFITLVSYAFHLRRIYLYYIGYVGCMSIYALLNDGWGMFLPTSLRWLDDTSRVAHWLGFGILFLMLFTRSFLNVDCKAGRWWQRINPLWLAVLMGVTTCLVDYGMHQNRFDMVRTGFQAGFYLLAVYAVLWLSYIVDTFQRRFRPVWLYSVAVLVWLFFYITNVFTINTGWLTEPFPDMLVFRVAVLAEVVMIFIGWMYRQRIIRESAQQLQSEQQARQQALLEAERQRQAEEIKALRLTTELQQQRERLARDLHDGIGSQLTHIAGRLDILSVRKTDEQPQLQRLSEFTRETNQSLRDTVWILNRSDIQVSTFSQRLHAYLLRLWEDIDAPQLDWQVDLPTNDPILSPLLVQSLFRITQEAVNNALKYACARTLSVHLTTQSDGGLTLSITDDGTGFDTTQSTYGYRLVNMQKRAEEAGGQWTLSSDSRGTRIYVRIDISR